MKYSLGVSNFLEEIASLSHSVVFLYFFTLIAEEGFLISPCYSLELGIQMLIQIQMLHSDSGFIPIPKKGNAKECSNYRTIALISHTSEEMLKILQARLQQYVNHELPVVQVGFRKGRGTRDQIANNCWVIEKAREFLKNIYFCFTGYAKAFDSVDHNSMKNS